LQTVVHLKEKETKKGRIENVAIWIVICRGGQQETSSRRRNNSGSRKEVFQSAANKKYGSPWY
jgi:hypothetical protein